ncbi:malonyl-ACP O-methyltransferase BioC [Bacillus sp. 3255]|uniref:malonyl-ACP O-methyltransferase BioC n=1 Tax=Bacillus sp. 3255 TaxID=2817904 RepID=UPI002856599C|nr:malonyl-ACP O-methyltransferase BioC [Bacillus sp. 3255]MDR6878379.1 malonyl-CoA O-methyltransferase [Bacillus sp. 3255]
MHSSPIARQFDRSSAGSYDRHAAVQRTMAMQLGEELPYEVAQPAVILDVGCGTGDLTGRLAAAWPQAAITALDIAPGMLQAAQRRLQSAQAAGVGVRFLQADVERWSPCAEEASFDLIVSSACFQWLRDPKMTLRHLRRMLRPGGQLAFSTFGPDTFYELHASFHEVYRSLNLRPQRHGLAFRSGAEWCELLAEAGFTSVHERRSMYRATYPSPRDFLLAVKELGASASEARAVPGVSARRLFAGMYQAYTNKFSTQEGVGATYELLTLRAKWD